MNDAFAVGKGDGVADLLKDREQGGQGILGDGLGDSVCE